MRGILVFYPHSPPQTFPINSTTVKFLPKALPTSHHPLKHFQSTPLLSDSYQKHSQLAITFLTRPVTLQKFQSYPSSPHLRRLFHYPPPPRFNTPPQTIPFIMDTGSDFVRFPYTRRYVCQTFSTTTGATIFVPKQSLSIRILDCLNPKCGLIQKNDNVNSRCQDYASNSNNCRHPSDVPHPQQFRLHRQCCAEWWWPKCR